MLHTRSCLLTPRQQHQLADLFASDCHVALEVTWSVYQNIIDAYRDPNKVRGKALVQAEINTLTSTRVPRSLRELITLGRTLKRRAGDTPGLLRPPPHHRRSHRSHQRTPRTPTRIRTRVPKPPQLHHPLPPRNRRIQTPTTPSIMKSRFERICGQQYGFRNNCKSKVKRLFWSAYVQHRPAWRESHIGSGQN